MMVFDTTSSDIRRTVLGVPDQAVRPGGRRAHLYENVRRGCGNLLVSTRYDTVGGRLTALFSRSPTFGFGWVPVRVQDSCKAQALAARLNSTPARLLLLNQRTRKLTYPKWSLTQLRGIRIPAPDNPAWDALADAWEQVREVELLPMRDAERCEARRMIDEAAAVALNVSPETVAGWRAMLAAEPTVTNRRAGTEA